MGMSPPASATLFKATGILSRKKVASKNHAGAWFLMWRCIYAEIVNSRVEKLTLNTEKALKRWTSMIIGRLSAYGLRWHNWVIAGRHQCEERVIPLKHRHKDLLEQDSDGPYWIHQSLYDLADELGLSYKVPHKPVDD